MSEKYKVRNPEGIYFITHPPTGKAGFSFNLWRASVMRDVSIKQYNVRKI